MDKGQGPLPRDDDSAIYFALTQCGQENETMPPGQRAYAFIGTMPLTVIASVLREKLEAQGYIVTKAGEGLTIGKL